MIEKPNSIPWPPIFYGFAIIAGFVLQAYLPLPWLPGFIGDFLVMAGILMILAAIFIDLRTFWELRKHNTTVLPHKAASHLVTTGPFAVSRNPIYVANTMLVFGIGVTSGSAWFLLTGLLAALATNAFGIKREEKHLEHRFGSAWRHYRKSVKRWI